MFASLFAFAGGMTDAVFSPIMTVKMETHYATAIPPAQ
jgi:hypothetical protein